MNIGNVCIEDKTAALAPMAGVADHAFRTLCKEFGASYVVGEMASAKGLTMSGRKTEELLAVTEAERPMSVQIFGDTPETMAEAARRCMAFRPDIIDINMGCPAPKVAGNGGGSALMKNPELAGAIAAAVVKAVPVPVTAKIRAGWDAENLNAVEVAKRLEAGGVSALTVHGRTREQMYAPPVDRGIIRRVKDAVTVPVIANGDVVDGPSAKAMLEETGADLVMVGRGAYGRPWVFHSIREYLQNGVILPEPSLTERLAVMLTHVEQMCLDKGERIAMKEARKHGAWYMKGLKGAAEFRRMMAGLNTYGDLLSIADQVLEGAALHG